MVNEKYVPISGLSLPISVRDIIDLPMDEFNDLLSKHELTEEQLTLCRDIRRRGKNKVSWMKRLSKLDKLLLGL
jgi:nuclear factor erythroid 2